MPQDFVIGLFEHLPKPVRSRLPYEKPWFIQFCKFVMVGATSSLIMLTILYSLTEFAGLHYLVSAAIGLVISAFNGYFWNHRWTFRVEGVRKHHSAFSKYFALNTATYLLNLSILALLVESFHVWYIFAEIVAILASLTSNFLGSRHWAFK